MPPYYIRSNNLALIAYTHDLVMVLSPGNYTHDTIHIIGHMYIGNPPPFNTQIGHQQSHTLFSISYQPTQ